MSQALYVRRCAVCGVLDTHSAFGGPGVVDPDRPWCCRSCPSTAWCLTRLEGDAR